MNASENFSAERQSAGTASPLSSGGVAEEEACGAVAPPRLVRWPLFMETVLTPVWWVGLLIFRGIRSRLVRHSEVATYFRRIASGPAHTQKERSRRLFWMAVRAKVRTLPQINRDTTELPNIERTLLLLDVRAYGSLPHWREQAASLPQILAQRIVKAVFPGQVSIERIHIEMSPSLRELLLPVEVTGGASRVLHS